MIKFGVMSNSHPESAADLRYVRVVCHDPEWVPFFAEGDIVRGPDVPPD